VAVIGVIPARMGSSRFPGKPLHMIAGKPMLQHVYERASAFKGWEYLIVATPDQEIMAYCQHAGIKCRFTPGSVERRALDACAEAAIDLPEGDIIVNVQGDEPLVTVENIDVIVRDMEMWITREANLLLIKLRPGDLNDKNAVKALTYPHGGVIYTTRQPVGAASGRVGGLFAFRNFALKQFTKMATNDYEETESCDINRWLGNGRRVYAVPAASPSYQSVDCLRDVAVVEAMML